MKKIELKQFKEDNILEKELKFSYYEADNCICIQDYSNSIEFDFDKSNVEEIIKFLNYCISVQQDRKEEI